LDFFHNNGGTLIDTAKFCASSLPGCAGGESETTKGFWLKQRSARDEMVLSSKLAFDYPGCAGGSPLLRSKRMRKESAAVQTDRLDIYYAHRDDRKTPLEETMGLSTGW
jgi:aryl-alcohol dehydrogenase-like predicted oxidoreductase